MRVSTTFIHNRGVQNMLEQQAKLIRLQDQVSTGEKNLLPSDNPVAASRVIDLNDAISQIDQFEENGIYAKQRLNLEESTLKSATNVLQRVRELTIQAANTGINDLQSERAIASELKEKLDELFDYANTRDENGDYVFSGFQSRVQAFTTDGLGNYTFNGDEGQHAIQIGSNRRVVANDSGAELFQKVRTGNGDFSVDINRTNVGSGLISSGSVQDPGAFLKHDYTIRFIDATNYEVVDTNLGAPVLPSPRTYSDGGVITFDGIGVDISGEPVAGDEFSVKASRYQNAFDTLHNLIADIDSPGTGDVSGGFGGGYLANNFANGDAITFDLDFDGQTINVAATAGLTDLDTANNIAAGLVAAGVTDNADGTYTLNGNTAGLSVTFQIDPATNGINFRSSGGNGAVYSDVTISSLTDTGNDGVLLLSNNGNTVASAASITTAGGSGSFSPGAPSVTLQNQQISNALDNIDRILDSVLNVQTSIGGRLNSIESQALDNEEKRVYLEDIRSEIKDLDLAEAISDMTYQTTILQVAHQSFVTVQNLNLFNFL